MKYYWHQPESHHQP